MLLSLMPGLKMEIIVATKSRSEDAAAHAFLAWKYQQQQSTSGRCPRSLVSAMLSCHNAMLSCHNATLILP